MGVGGLEATVCESDGVATGLLGDAFGNGVATIRGGVVLWTPVPLAGYGPVHGCAPPQLSDYHTLAEVSLWRGQRVDPTGLYWHGTRYYDARAGRFLSPDPLSHAASWDLYSFARNDPVNFFDPDGRFGQQIWTHGCEYGRNLFDLGLNAWIGFVQVQNPIPVQMQTPVPDPITSSGYFGRRLGQATGAAVSLIQLAEGIPLIGIGLGADVTGLGLVATLAGAPGGAVLIGAGTAATGLGVVLTSEGVVGLNNFIYAQTGPPPSSGGSSQQGSSGSSVGGGSPNLPSTAGAEPRTFSSSDPLVANLANKIERAYPGHVVRVNEEIRNINGQLVTDLDIVLKNAIIQVKSGHGKHLGLQLVRTEQATGLPAIRYGPTLRGRVVIDIAKSGGLVTRDEELLIQLVKP